MNLSVNDMNLNERDNIWHYFSKSLTLYKSDYFVDHYN